MKLTNTQIMVILCSCLMVVFLLSICIGTKNINLINATSYLFSNSVDGIVVRLRLIRFISACIIGAGFSMSGLVLQSLLQNKMADPFVLGISGGAGIGVALSFILISVFPILALLPVSEILSFLFSIITIYIAYFFSRTNGKVIVSKLLLIGMAISFFEISLLHIMSAFNFKDFFIVFLWLMGSLAEITLLKTLYGFIVFIISYIFFSKYSKELDILLQGDDTAKSLGVPVEKIKFILIIVLAFLIATLVVLGGVVGFIGLIIPNIVKSIFGPKHAVNICFSAVFGAVFLSTADLVARSIISPNELPLGSIVTIIGVPYFIYLIRKTKKYI